MEERIAALLADGQAAARAGEKVRARRKFRLALLHDADNVTALLWLAWLADDLRSSVGYIYRALARDPGNADAYAALRWVRLRLASRTPQGPPPNADSRAAPRRWGRVAVTVALCLLIALIDGVPDRAFSEPPSVAAASAQAATPVSTSTASPTPTAIPTWTPTATLPPTVSPTPPHLYSSLETLSPTSPAVLLTSPPLPPVPTLSPESFHGDVRWIEVDLTHQVLNAYEGQKLVRTSFVSTGKQDTPTPVGLFRVQIKMRYDDMDGPDYYLPRVPYVMYFYRGYGLHGTYWHANFGHPMSHGCVNLPTVHAEWLFNWAEMGTLVYIHE